MRHFVVLGFKSNSKGEAGEVVYLGSDRAEALAEVADVPSGGDHARRELYELAVPHVRRHRPEGAAGPEAAQEPEAACSACGQDLTDRRRKRVEDGEGGVLCAKCAKAREE